MSGDDVTPPEPIAAMLAELEDETAHMTPEYLARGLAQVEAEYARRVADDDAEIQRLADLAERGYGPHQLRPKHERRIADQARLVERPPFAVADGGGCDDDCMDRTRLDLNDDER